MALDLEADEHVQKAEDSGSLAQGLAGPGLSLSAGSCVAGAAEPQTTLPPSLTADLSALCSALPTRLCLRQMQQNIPQGKAPVSSCQVRRGESAASGKQRQPCPITTNLYQTQDLIPYLSQQAPFLTPEPVPASYSQGLCPHAQHPSLGSQFLLSLMHRGDTAPCKHLSEPSATEIPNKRARAPAVQGK